MDLELNKITQWYYNIGQAEINVNNYSQAFLHFKNGLKIQTDNRFLNLMCGYCLLNLKKIAEAENYFIKAISLAPNTDIVFSDISSMFQDEGKIDDCIKLFKQCAVQFPQKSSLNYGLANMYRIQKDYINALLNYYKVLELRNTDLEREALKNSQFYFKIAEIKIELRKQTNDYLETLETDISLEEGRKIFEYEYFLPESLYLFPNQRRIFEFGKYIGYTVNEILTQDPEYICWCILNVKHFCACEEIIEILKRKNLITPKGIEANFLKMKLKEANYGEYLPNPDPNYDFDNFDYDEAEEPSAIFEFNLEGAAKVYRNWYIKGTKDKNAFFDNEQEDDLFHYLLEELKKVIDFLSNCDKHDCFKFELPFLIINEKYLRQITVELLYTDTDVTCMNIPGCSAIGYNNEEKTKNIIRAIIEATDFRIKSGLSIRNRVIPMESSENEFLRFTILMDAKEIQSTHLIDKLKFEGWNLFHDYKYNFLLGNEDSKCVFTIPKVEIIPKATNGWFELLMLFGKRTNRKTSNL